jgi:hypothetical protein
VAQPDYAETTNERLWIANESTFNTLAYPAVTDEIIPLPGVDLPAAITERTPSVERNPSAGIRALIKRKKPPSAWTIPLYLKGSDTPGSAPSYGLLLKKGLGAESFPGGNTARYDPIADITEQSVTIWHYLDNLMRGLRGALVNQIEISISGTDEGRITFRGFATNEVFAGTSVLNDPGGISSTDTAVIVADSTRFQVGPASTDKVRGQIESEVVEISAINYGTHTHTIARAQAGTSAAAHANALEFAPWVPGADTDPADLIFPLTAGSLDLGALTGLRIISATVLIDNHIEARLEEYGQSVATGYRRTPEKRTVTGSVRAFLRQAAQSILTDLEREIERNTILTASATGAGSARLRITMPKLNLRNVRFDGGGPEFIVEADFQALESSTGNDEINLIYD